MRKSVKIMSFNAMFPHFVLLSISIPGEQMLYSRPCMWNGRIITEWPNSRKGAVHCLAPQASNARFPLIEPLTGGLLLKEKTNQYIRLLELLDVWVPLQLQAPV